MTRSRVTLATIEAAAIAARQIRLLRLLRFRPLAPLDLQAFHAGELTDLPPRSYLVTVDDGPVRRRGRTEAETVDETRFGRR